VDPTISGLFTGPNAGECPVDNGALGTMTAAGATTKFRSSGGGDFSRASSKHSSTDKAAPTWTENVE